MNKSNDSGDDDFWGKYTPAEDIQEQISDDSNAFTKRASISWDGEQHFVRFPTEISDLKDLSKYEVEFTGVERPEKPNKIHIELVKKDA